MSMEGKILFINRIREKMAVVIPSDTMDAVTEIVRNVLEGFEMDQVQTGEGVNLDMLETYLDALSIQGRSKKTIERYRYEIKRMMKAVNVPTHQLTVFHLRAYLGAEKQRGISDRTLDGNRQVFSAYFNWLQREGLITKNPTANLGTIKCIKKVKDFFTDADIERLKEACHCKRDKAIVCFLLSTGARISEVTSLNRDAIDSINRECKVLGKGNKERIVYLDSVSAMMVSDYLNERKDDLPALFIGKGCDRLTPNGVRAMLKRLEAESGVNNVHPHKFRRTMATNMIRRGMPIQEVAAILGHEKIDTTMKYIVLDMTEVKNSFRKCS